ncbi:amino acid permease [Candidatus Babeliales bacterium]|nr:amino acid permease [Candidatus Babeliales bacterium]
MKNNIHFWLVIIMNMNVMMGAGVFVNLSPLTSLAGSLSALSYVVMALMVLPLVLVIAELAKINPAVEGGLFSYSKEGLGVTAGTIGVVTYFFAKTISQAVLLRAIVLEYLPSIFPIFSKFSGSLLIIVTAILFGFLNARGMKFGSKLQLIFMFLKGIPVLAAILLLGFIFTPSYFTVETLPTVGGFSSALPIALYAMMGFETCCSIGHTVKGGEKHLYKIVVTSFLLVASLLALFQFSLYACLGPSLSGLEAPLGIFFTKLESIPFLDSAGKMLANSFILLSMMGAYYGIMQANNWNMFAIAKDLNKFLIFTRTNKHGMPIWCIVLQVIVSLFFALSMMQLPSLQRIVVFGIVVCYFLTVFAFLKFYKFKRDQIVLPKIVAYLSVVSCLYISYQCVKGLIL